MSDRMSHGVLNMDLPDDIATLERIYERFMCDLQADLENGISCLNDIAAAKFLAGYPALASFGEWLSDQIDAAEGYPE